jgi:hypothetical protein
MSTGFPSLAGTNPSPREIMEVVNRINGGKINAVTTVTLTANSATTAFADPLLAVGSFLGFMPTTANAKTEGTPYVTAQGTGVATLNHANNAQTDRVYMVLVIG